MTQPIDTTTLQTLIDIAVQSGIQELQVTYADTAVRISCYPNPSAPSTNAPTPSAKAVAHTDKISLLPPALSLDANAIQKNSPVSNVAQSGTTINAPMLGTLYHKADPDAKPFVEIGQRVKKGDTLCIVEAMKIMHEVKADTEGVITEILADDGAMVEYNEPLFGFQSE